MITFNFYSFAERKPHCGEEIIYLYPRYGFGMVGFEPCETTAEYQWTELDENDYPTGTVVSYDPEDPDPPEGKWMIQIVLDGNIPDDDWYWCSYACYEAAFNEENKHG